MGRTVWWRSSCSRTPEPSDATLESEIPIGLPPHYPGTGRALIDIGATPAG